MFETPDSVHLVCCNQLPPVRGRAEYAVLLASTFGDVLNEESMQHSYIDAEGAVVEYLFRTDYLYTYDPPGGGEPLGPDELQISENAADGAAKQTIHAMALAFLESWVGQYKPENGRELRAAQPLMDRYLAAWSGRDGRAVGELYSPNATLTDSLLGVRLNGRRAIGSFAAEHGGVRLQQGSIPRGGGPAIYGFWRDPGHLTAYLTYVGDDGKQCPGSVTAQLQIEAGQIVAERRYHDVASMRRCVDNAVLPDGWWTHAVIPDATVDQLTGTVTVAGQRIEVHNGPPEANDLVRWGISRFPAARLTAPTVASVAFSEEAHQAQCAGDLRGLALKAGPSSRIYLCYAEDGTSPPFARELLLHELAHVWMWENLDQPTQQRFIDRFDLPTWDVTDVPRDKRGIEQAADVIAWGLADEPSRNSLLANRSCADRAEAFKLLTNAAPLQPPCPSVG